METKRWDSLYTNEERMDMREKLREYISPEGGGSIRAELKAYADANYIRQHTAEEYMRFMNRNTCSFTVHHNQSTNHPYYWGLFTVRSQHILGDCVEECLDKAMSN